MKILVVDDKKENRYLLEVLLKGSGYEVSTAANGADALEKIRAQGCNMIISDILMPVMDGFQFCRAVKNKEEMQDIPFVFYTATYTDEKDEELALKLGADMFIRKPIEPYEFMKRIQRVIKQAEEGETGGRRPNLKEDEEILELYSERLVKKLEKKMFALEREVTERKLAEKALQEREEKYRILFEGSAEGILVADIETKEFKYANPKICKMLGFTEEELKQMNVSDIHPEDALEHVISEFEAQARGEKILSPSIPCLTKNGRIIYTDIKTAKVLIDDRECNIGFFTDITERKKAEEELSRLRNLLSNIVDSMPSVLVGVDTEGRVTQWNREAEKVTGVKADDARGRALSDVFPQLAGEMKKLRQSILDRKPRKETKVARQSNGEIVYSDITVYPLVTNGVEGAVIRIDDVTERVRIEEMMIHSEKMMSLGGLAAGMAHEINNPLAGILQNMQVMRNRVTADHPKNQSTAEECGTTMNVISAYMDKRGLFEIIESIMESGRRAAKVVDNMLSFSRKGEVERASHDICDLLDKAVDLAEKDYDLKKKYDFRRIEIVRKYDTSVPRISCEASKIQQVFLNILKNGAQAMTEGRGLRADGGREKPRFILRVLPEGGMARIEIEDNGPGMTAEVRKRVFDPFFTTKGDGVGTGLGLSVSYFIITENHGGKMAVESVPGKGSKFIIRLPFGSKGKDT